MVTCSVCSISGLVEVLWKKRVSLCAVLEEILGVHGDVLGSLFPDNRLRSFLLL